MTRVELAAARYAAMETATDRWGRTINRVWTSAQWYARLNAYCRAGRVARDRARGVV